MIVAKVVNHPLKLDELLALPLPPGHGAQILFTGRVRNRNVGRDVRAVSYDAFEPLAEKTLLAIAAETRQKWQDHVDITVIHRVGHLEIGDISVVIHVSAPHRDEAFRASREVIDQLKARAPIWKKEHYADGESEWLQGHALCGHTSSLEGEGHHG